MILTDKDNPFVKERAYFNEKYGNGEGDSCCNRDIHAFNMGAKAQLKKDAEEIVDDLTAVAIHSNPSMRVKGISKLCEKWQSILKEAE